MAWKLFYLFNPALSVKVYHSLDGILVESKRLCKWIHITVLTTRSASSSLMSDMLTDKALHNFSSCVFYILFLSLTSYRGVLRPYICTSSLEWFLDTSLYLACNMQKQCQIIETLVHNYVSHEVQMFLFYSKNMSTLLLFSL